MRIKLGSTLRAAFALAVIAAALVVPAAAHAVATATTEPAYNITSNSANVNGVVNSQTPATYHFDYATEEDFIASGTYTHETERNIVGHSFFGAIPVPLVGIGVGVGDVLTGLAPNKVYHFRLVATENPCAGTPEQENCPAPTTEWPGQDLTFRTLKKKA